MNTEEMFKKLGYEKNDNIYYKGDYYISFNDYNISKYLKYKDPYLGWCEFSIPITIDELRAINQKCKELGWLDEEEKH